jgi:hypothetical protein
MSTRQRELPQRNLVNPSFRYELHPPARAV